ncbi:hypothetical protein MTsPCn9_00560 [Croceitalea sp. MTPC9]|uniref:YdeI/OmpD-associated family protein n=1 Tax=unclassified Croceitalea TaxID=2632280 RepID=UPI002B387478|nr:hypothetical protein MTsPCn6_08150 [Croceitalea sp. MTPC6]GMN15120.1 hypothetical protein MTsPCn9_00560 [Croceitalea sp. MTPC9]
MDKSEKIEAYFAEEHHYKKAIGILREIALKTKMEETFKWMFPTYTVDGKNVLAICKFKNHFGIWFFNGVFLKDSLNVLKNAQEGKTKAMRHWKFTAEDQIDKNVVRGYMIEAIENQKNGRVLAPTKSTKKTVIPKLLSKKLADDKKLKSAFDEFSTYKQKEFYEYIETAKQEKTKLSRLGKILPMIMEGTGLNDKYR